MRKDFSLGKMTEKLCDQCLKIINSNLNKIKNEKNFMVKIRYFII